jgi:ABC-type uncharacterized transport system ATPase subunit
MYWMWKSSISVALKGLVFIKRLVSNNSLKLRVNYMQRDWSCTILYIFTHRAVYKQAEIYILDDPLSAVDAHVGCHLFDECICNFLQTKTRLLVTHQLQYLQTVDSIVFLNNVSIWNLSGSLVTFVMFKFGHPKKNVWKTVIYKLGQHDILEYILTSKLQHT